MAAEFLALSELQHTPFLTLENFGEIARIMKITTEIDSFVDDGIYDMIEEKAEDFAFEFRYIAPYDFQEIDDYHMSEHIEVNDYNDPEDGKGKEIDSEAAYSGLLEYGHTWHGKHQNWFRPTMYKDQALMKAAVVKKILEIFRG